METRHLIILNYRKANVWYNFCQCKIKARRKNYHDYGSQINEEICDKQILLFKI